MFFNSPIQYIMDLCTLLIWLESSIRDDYLNIRNFFQHLFIYEKKKSWVHLC